MKPLTHDVVVIGAGMAGLACAVQLKEFGLSALVVDAADQVGGKIRTDEHDGFLLDRGFQVLLTAYPETRRLLNFPSLQLAHFHSGALVRSSGAFSRLGDPTRHPGDLLATVASDVGSLWDKLRTLRLSLRVCAVPLDQVLARPETTTAQRLAELGFSSGMIERFFRPFLGGIFLERALVTSSRKFEFVFRMFSTGTAALPATGMRALPLQLASRLSAGQLRLHQEVVQVAGSQVHLASGEILNARQIVVATDAWTAARLVSQKESTIAPATLACLYFAAPVSPVQGSWLVLNGEGLGPINNLTVPSDLQPLYAPRDQSLISVTVLDSEYLQRSDLENCVRSQLVEWYGDKAAAWRHLRTYHIPRAVPLQLPPALTPVEKSARIDSFLVQCGDSLDIASIEGSVKSGLRAAREVLRTLSGSKVTGDIEN